MNQYDHQALEAIENGCREAALSYLMEAARKDAENITAARATEMTK